MEKELRVDNTSSTVIVCCDGERPSAQGLIDVSPPPLPLQQKEMKSHRLAARTADIDHIGNFASFWGFPVRAGNLKKK